jgi:hypothetical protein
MPGQIKLDSYGVDTTNCLVVGAPSWTLPDPLGDAAQRKVQAGEITAAPAALPGILGPDRLAWHEMLKRYRGAGPGCRQGTPAALARTPLPGRAG